MFSVGDKVKYVGGEHDGCPDFYPEVGTVGMVTSTATKGNVRVRWPNGSTSDLDEWYVPIDDVELVESRNNRSLAYQMRKEGKTLQAIADELGVTKQRVCQYFTGTKYEGGKHYRKMNSIIYPNLADWLYENNHCIATFMCEMGMEYNPRKATRVKSVLDGKAELKISEIKKILSVTGMTFEECFKEVEHEP